MRSLSRRFLSSSPRFLAKALPDVRGPGHQRRSAEMMAAMDHTPLGVLQAQQRQLAVVIERLVRARAEHLPAKATFWRGSARTTYDRAIGDLAAELDEAVEVVRLAWQSTTFAIAEEVGGA